MRILIVKTSALGDIIHTFPALQLLKMASNDTLIDWVVEKPFSSLVDKNPLVDHALLIETKKWRRFFWRPSTWKDMFYFVKNLRRRPYDLIIDFQANLKSGLITRLAKGLRKVGFGQNTVHEWPNLLFTNEKFNPPPHLNIREDYLYLAQQAINKASTPATGLPLIIEKADKDKINEWLKPHKQVGNLPLFMVCPGSQWENKTLKMETLIAFLEKIQHTFPATLLFIWGTAKEKRVAEDCARAFFDRSIVVEKLPLEALQYLMSQVDLVISMDSLPLHLAGTTKTPTYSIFGPSSAQKFRPNDKQHRAFQGSCPYGQTFEKRCPILRTCTTGSCMRSINAEHLFQHFSNWWMNSSR